MRRKSTNTDNALLASVRQLCTILKDEGQPWDTHIILENNWAVAHNNIVGIGEKTKEDIQACPNAFILREALSKCGQSLSITQLEHKLSIKSDKFRALVPCMPRENMTLREPDAPIAPIDDRLKVSISAAASIALDDENRIELASILIHGGSVVATDGKLVLEHWHGIDLPPYLTLPKAVIDPVLKNTKQLKQFGYSNSSCTFYYEDESWLKTQLYVEKWPDVSRILDKTSNALPLPDGFYTAVKALEKFSKDGFVYFDTNCLRSCPDDTSGASYEVYGLPKGPVLNIKQLKLMEPYIKTIDFFVPHGNHKMTLFYGDNCRGAIAGRV